MSLYNCRPSANDKDGYSDDLFPGGTYTDYHDWPIYFTYGSRKKKKHYLPDYPNSLTTVASALRVIHSLIHNS